MATNFIQKACEILKRAIQADNDENYETAVSLYSQGIQYLMTGLKYEKNRKVKVVIKDKVQKYLTRAEEIQSTLLSSTNKTKKRKKKKLHKYPTQQQINDAINDTEQSTIHLIHGYTREMEKLLNINYCIPDGIVRLCIVYFHIPIVYSPEDPRKYIDKPNIKLDDIAGLTDAKRELKEFAILPLRFPALFTKFKGSTILLYGPPGTGKSFVCKAVGHATNNATFFNISSSDLCSKYYGGAVKMIKNIFHVARNKKPSIICFDEIDSFCSGRRGSSDNQRRIMSEFLVQIQGFSASSNKQIVLIGITNCPWNISPLVRRRFKKRIYFPLPEQEVRQQMFRIYIGDIPNNLCEQDYEILGHKTNGYSGMDIKCIVQDSMMEPVRILQKATHFKRVVNEYDDSDYKLMVCNSEDNGAIKMGLLDIPEHEQNKIMVEALEMKHFLPVLESSKASVSAEDIQRYIDWRDEFEEENN